jgi:serine phosphatase RsbU (regulator of sigma subunit)
MTGSTRPRRARPLEGEAPVGSAVRAEADPASSMRFLADAARDLNSSLKLDDVFRRIADRVRELMDYDLFCVMLWNEETGLLEHSFSLCHGEHVPQAGGFPLGYGVSGTAAATRATVRVPDVTRDPRYVRARHPEVEIHSELAVPLLSKDRLVGVLDLESVGRDTYTEAHEGILSTLASYIATALDNAGLYEKLLASERRMERDLAMAREVQKGLLSPAPPGVRGLDVGLAYAPARELGGDFYDFLPYGGGRTAFAVGDVAGKSTPAALFGAMSVGILRGYGYQHRVGPSAMLRYMNERLHLPRVGPRFLAMVFAVFDEMDGSLTVANGGVPWPYLVSGGRVDKIPIAGMPLGLIDAFEYDDWRRVMQPGDVVALCSDGLSEATGASGEQFGDTRVREVLIEHASAPAQAIAAALLEAAARHSGGRRLLSDDCTVVVLKSSPV